MGKRSPEASKAPKLPFASRRGWTDIPPAPAASVATLKLSFNFVDKKNTVIGVLLIAAAIASMYLGNRNSTQRATPEALRQAATQQAPASQGPEALVPPGPQPEFVSANVDVTGSQVTKLHNSFIEVRFTDYGGAIRDVALTHRKPDGQYQYPEAIDDPTPFIFNKLHVDPALALVGVPGLDRMAHFQLVSSSAQEVVYRATIPGKWEVTRRYVLPLDAGEGTDPYQLRSETTFRNLSPQPTQPFRVGLAVGTAAPAYDRDNGMYLAAWYSDGKSPSSIPRVKFEASGGFFGLNAHGATPVIESPGPTAWAAVSNQFFIGILTPDKPAAGLAARRAYLLTQLSNTDSHAYGVTQTAQFDVPSLEPGAQTVLGASYYVGPKEYRRLSNAEVFKFDQDGVMQFGWFKFFSALLLTLMTWIHSFVPSWGLSIILTTLTLKTIFIYPTLASFRSSRRMQKIQPQLKALNEKYKDNPQKKNQATMELFKEHKVNPLGGCLPILFTMPFFFGFYRMLMSTAELRFAHFLWAADLSAPDTVGHLPGLGIAINILPLILGVVSFLQVKLSPQPTVDNAQAKMMMFTPLIMLVFCYSFSCALSLYSTTNGLFTIAQQLVVNRMRDDGDPDTAKAAAGGTGAKAIKNVTPKRKK